MEKMTRYLSASMGLSSYLRRCREEGVKGVKRGEYRLIQRMYAELILDLILDGHTVHLPQRMGVLKVLGTKTNLNTIKKRDKLIDWNSTKNMWKSNPEAKKKGKVLHFENLHTDGVVYRIAWYSRGTYLDYKKMFLFYASRCARRKLCRRIMEGMRYEISPERMMTKTW